MSGEKTTSLTSSSASPTADRKYFLTPNNLSIIDPSASGYQGLRINLGNQIQSTSFRIIVQSLGEDCLKELYSIYSSKIRSLRKCWYFSVAQRM